MIRRRLALAFCLFAAIAFSGCSKTGSSPLGSFSNEFKSASPEVKAQADLVVAACKTNGYVVAFTTLQDMRTAAVTPPEKQEAAIASMMEFVMNQLNEQAAKGNADAVKMKEQLQSLRGR